MAATSRHPFAYALALGCFAALLVYFVPSLDPTKFEYDFKSLKTDISDLNNWNLNSFNLNFRKSVAKGSSEYDWATRKDHYLVSEYTALPEPNRKTLPKIQHSFKPEPQSKESTRKQRQKEIRSAIDRSWRSYRKHASPMDELRSQSGTASDTYGEWALTLVESLDTLWIAGFKDEFKEAAANVSRIDFSVTTKQEDLDVYEVSSRILGGLISAYELSWKQSLKEKAIELANMLYAAFDTPNRMPNTHWNMLKTKTGAKQQALANATIGDVAGLAMEFTRLAIVTNDPKWYDAVARVTDTLAEQQESTQHPDLFPVHFNAQESSFREGDEVHLGKESKAFYDSMPRMYALLRGSDQYKAMSKSAMDSITQHILFQPMVPPGSSNTELLLPGTLINGTLSPQVHHGACSMAGTLAYTGRILRNEAYISTAVKLLHGCLWASQASPLGIMPHTFAVTPCTLTTSKDCTWDEYLYSQALLHQHNEPDTTDPKVLTWKHRLPQGFTSIPSRHYALDSSLISSIFTLYRITGDESLPEHAWQLWRSVYGRSKTQFAHAAISDVTQPQAPKEDIMPSEWMGATLKYFYLMFAGPEEVTLDRWVMGTRGHVYRLERSDLK